MMNTLRYLFFTVLLLFACLSGAAGQEVPKIINFKDHPNTNKSQTWGIAQDDHGFMYFGSKRGLLKFDGSRWKHFSLPNKQTIRSLAVINNQVFTGGFEEFGYWEHDPEQELKYYSVSKVLEQETLRKEEIWHILPIEEGVLFQSFSTIYTFRDGELSVFAPPGNIMFTQSWGGRIVVPVIGQGLYELKKDNQFQIIEGSSMFTDKMIAFTLPVTDSLLLIGTKNKGIFQYDGRVFSVWNESLNQSLNQYQINKAIKLDNGNIAIGTILEGAFIFNETGELLYHLNQKKGLQNNTILSLFSDQNQQLWIGTDKGVNLALLNSPLTYHVDYLGAIGTVYAAVIYWDNLFVGTNQGLFWKSFEKQEAEELPFHLVPGTQGQVWDLKIIGGELYCGHNQGTFKIKKEKAEKISHFTGGWQLMAYCNSYVQATYTGLVLFDKAMEMQSKIIGLNESIRHIETDQQGKIWAVHPQRGLYRLELSEKLDSIVVKEVFGEEKGLPTAYNLGLFKLNGQIIVKSGMRYFRFNEKENKFEPLETWEGQKLTGKNWWMSQGDNGDLFLIEEGQMTWVLKSKEKHVLNVDVPFEYNSIISLDSNYYFVFLGDGYALLDKQKGSFQNYRSQTYLTSLKTTTRTIFFPGLSENPSNRIALTKDENDVKINFTNTDYTTNAGFSYFLGGFSNKWSEFEKINNQTFTNLPSGDYTFRLKSKSSPGQVVKLDFSIAPQWYETALARSVFLAFLLFGLYWLYRWHQYRMRKQRYELLLARAKQLREERIRNRNEKLKMDILNKSTQLANSTMDLIKKNEILLNIKAELDNLKSEASSSKGSKPIQHIQKLIDRNISDENDWQLFETNFNLVHEQFLKKLKEKHPDLTPGDLRLAAYLRMNLSTKEIAPLLNISIRGVENKRYRLRKKLKLNSVDNLTEYLIQF